MYAFHKCRGVHTLQDITIDGLFFLMVLVKALMLIQRLSSELPTTTLWSRSSLSVICSCGFILYDGSAFTNPYATVSWVGSGYGVASCFYILLFVDLSCVIITFVEEYMVF